MVTLFISLLIFQLIISLDYIFPGKIDAIVEWHKDLFKPMEIEK